jgi:DTW domain-containing protein
VPQADLPDEPNSHNPRFMTSTPPTQRAHCNRCLRPRGVCICRWITPTAHAAEVVVLQHPLEAHSAKGSARLLHLSLLRSQMATGEAFAEQHLQALLYEPVFSEAAKQPLLLYPRSPNEPAAIAVPPEMLRDPQQLRLIVIDATWRKSRKMLHLNPLLRRLPRLALHDTPTSRYLIRKAHRADQLSTLEATCMALAQLEGNAARFAPLLCAFDGFVAQQMNQRDAGMAAGGQANRHL